MSLQLRSTFACVVAGLTLTSASTADADPTGWRSGNMIAVWEQPTLTAQPPARTAAALGSLGKVVLFGGLQGTTASNDTWEWDGSLWKQSAPGTKPPARSDHAVATLGNHLVLFGGTAQGGSALADTWEWNGTDWTSKSPATSPPARHGHALSLFLGTKMVVVLFGGLDSGGVRKGDTWTWDGTTWAQASPAQSPSARANHAITTLGPKLVLFGGEDGTGFTNDTWEWDGTTWTHKQPASSPPARAGHSLTTWNSRVVMFGGQGSAGPLNDTWEWDGTKWTQMTATTSPSKRTEHALALHTQGVVLFGGTTTADTWTYHSGLDNGSACAKPGDCAFGHCSDNLCCDKECEGQCESCNQAGALGTCKAIQGTPTGGRPPCAGSLTCTTTCDAGDDACAPSCEAGSDPCQGVCDGVNRAECTYPSDASVCVQPGCSNGEINQAAYCSGSGLCAAPKKTSCGDYGCSGMTCKTSCTTPSDCASGRLCVNQKCEMPEGGITVEAGPSDSGEDPPEDASLDSPAAAEESSSKCGCRTVGTHTRLPVAWLLAGLAIGVLARRKSKTR